MPLLFLNILFLFGCAHQSIRDTNTFPNWMTDLPKQNGMRFFVGESRSAENKDDALERAWITTLIRFGMTEFPELAQLKSQSSETLRSANYKREFLTRLELIDWTGVREATEFGSPYVAADSSGKFTVFRLLKWSEKSIEEAHVNVKLAKKFAMPSSPEESLQVGTISSSKLMDFLNRPDAFESFSYGDIQRFPKIKIGIKKSEILAIFGAPISIISECQIYPCEGFWQCTKLQVLVYSGPMCNKSYFNSSSGRRLYCDWQRFGRDYELERLKAELQKSLEMAWKEGRTFSTRDYLQRHKQGTCAVGLDGNEVDLIENFHFNYTEDLQ